MASRGGTLFQLDGLRGLEATMDRVSQAVRDRVADAVEDTAHAVQNRAKLNLLPHRDRGDLLRAVGISGRGLRFRVGLEDGSVPARGGTNTAHLNPWVYGQFLEYGTQHPFRPAHPFMGPAAESERPLHEQRIGRALGEAVSR